MFSEMIHKENPYVLTKEEERTIVDGIYVIRPKQIQWMIEDGPSKGSLPVTLKAVFFERAGERYLAIGDTLNHDMIAGSALLEVRKNNPNFQPTNWGGGFLLCGKRGKWEFDNGPSTTMDKKYLPVELGPEFISLIKKLETLYRKRKTKN